MSFKSKETEVASQLREDFKEFEERCMGILLFGSYADEERIGGDKKVQRSEERRCS